MLFTNQLVYKHIEFAILFMSRKNNSGNNHLISEIIHIAKFKTNPKAKVSTHKEFETIPHYDWNQYISYTNTCKNPKEDPPSVHNIVSGKWSTVI